MTTERGNLFAKLPDRLPEELVEVLCEADAVRIERIVSEAHASPPGFWYDQVADEWVVLLQGRAIIRIDGQPEPVNMGSGDYLHLPAHCRHRVEETAAQGRTIWLAIHFATSDC